MPAAQICDPPATALDLECPWLGLRSYEEKDKDLFFGRQTECKELLDCVQHRHTTVLYGRSGLGKTSLVRAGLTRDLLASGYQPIFHRIRYGVEDPEPALQLMGALVKNYGELTSPELDLYLILHDPSVGFCGPFPRYKPPVFLLDQFEEVFTLGAELTKVLKGKRDVITEVRDLLSVIGQNFIAKSLAERLEKDQTLCERLDQESHPSRLLISLRDDYVYALDRWKRELPALGENRYELLPLNGPNAKLAVLKPGKLRDPARPIVTDECADEIVRFVAGDKEKTDLADITAVPPLLSLICEQLNARRLKKGAEQIQPNFQKETAEEILEDYYHERFKNRPDALRRLVEDKLVDEHGIRQPYNLRQAIEDLTGPCGSEEAAKELLEKIQNERLVTVIDAGGIARLELTHDILCKAARASRAKHRAAVANAKAARKIMWVGGLIAAAVVTVLIMIAYRHREITAEKLKQRAQAASMFEAQQQALANARSNTQLVQRLADERSAKKQLEDQLAAAKLSQSRADAAKDAEKAVAESSKRARMLLLSLQNDVRLRLTGTQQERLKDALNALDQVSRSTESVAVATTEVAKAAEDLSQSLSTSKGPPIPNAKPPRPSNILWAFYGYQTGGVWTERHFKNKSGNDGLPSPGDTLIAQTEVNIRKDVIRYVPEKDEWQNAPSVGVLKPNQQIQVIEVRGPGDEDPANFIWVTFTNGKSENVSRHSGVRWAAYGFADKKNEWTEQFFKPAKGGNDEPVPGDEVIATGDIFARRDYLRFDPKANSWLNFPDDVGLVRKGQKVKVISLAYPKDPSDTSESRFVWISF